MEDLVRQLIAQGAETRTLDYKGPMAWEGTKAKRSELIRDLMCFANTPDGGYIVIGVAEGAGSWRAVGVSKEQAKTFDPTSIGDLAQEFCSALPVFQVNRVRLEDKLFVLIAIEEISNQPIICIKDLHDAGAHVLRAGSVYARTVDAKCSEIRTGEAMQRLLDLAVRNRGDALLSQIAGLFGGHPTLEIPPSDAEKFEPHRASAEQFFNENEIGKSHWAVEIRPERFIERVVQTRSDLAKVRDDAEVSLRGWDFPHVDRQHSTTFAEGIQSATRFMYHHEAHRVFFSGLFEWRSAIREDFEAAELHNTLLYVSTIWSFTEIWLFASRFLASIVERGNAVVHIAIRGLKGRRLSAEPDVSFWPDSRASEEDEWSRLHVVPLGEVRGNHLDHAASDAIDLFELFGLEVEPRILRVWQEKLLRREF